MPEAIPVACNWPFFAHANSDIMDMTRRVRANGRAEYRRRRRKPLLGGGGGCMSMVQGHFTAEQQTGRWIGASCGVKIEARVSGECWVCAVMPKCCRGAEDRGVRGCRVQLYKQRQVWQTGRNKNECERGISWDNRDQTAISLGRVDAGAERERNLETFLPSDACVG